jgi:hypothetical protein
MVPDNMHASGPTPRSDLSVAKMRPRGRDECGDPWCLAPDVIVAMAAASSPPQRPRRRGDVR